MTDLSLAAQAVIEAACTLADLLNREVSQDEMIAAAVRALAEQANPNLHIEDIQYQHQSYVDGWKDALDVTLAIAAELEGG